MKGLAAETDRRMNQQCRDGYTGTVQSEGKKNEENYQPQSTFYYSEYIQVADERKGTEKGYGGEESL